MSDAQIMLDDGSLLSKRIVSYAKTIISAVIKARDIRYAAQQEWPFVLYDRLDLTLWVRFNYADKADRDVAGPPGIIISVNGVRWLYTLKGIARIGEVV